MGWFFGFFTVLGVAGGEAVGGYLEVVLRVYPLAWGRLLILGVPLMSLGVVVLVLDSILAWDWGVLKIGQNSTKTDFRENRGKIETNDV